MARRRRQRQQRPARTVDYRTLVNPFSPHEFYQLEQVEEIHATAVRILRDIGVRVLLAEARDLLAAAGCLGDDDHVVSYTPEAIAAAIESAPAGFEMMGASSATNTTIDERHVVWTPAGGIPHVSDLDSGKRPATMEDVRVFLALTEHFDVMHVNSSAPEPQDVDPALRHLETLSAMLRTTTKTPFVYARGSAQTADAFQMIRIARRLSADEFADASHCYTVINTNSPLQLDIPMMRGTIDFARAGQMVCITPFTLSGAMAPVTIAGALAQQHAEFLAALVVHQQARAGAPVVYGGFTSNVDMRSGAPAFGTPENVKAAFASGQLARHLGIPLRLSMASTSNAVDAQAAYETNMAMWGSLLGGSNLTLHAAGWMEGGLTASFEKFIVDVEVLQQAAELMQPVRFDESELAFDTIAAVGQGGHFFGEAHTMARFETAYYDPIVSDWSNFGTWTEAGRRDTATRANAIWKQVVADFVAPGVPDDIDEQLGDFVERRSREGGAAPAS